jgi:pimeloyl-ACP methyl ester carboxylesterase
VPTDLLDIPAISYFQHRNRGQLEDIEITSSMLQKYTTHYRKNPRQIFQLNFPQKSQEIIWTKTTQKGPFFYSTGMKRTPYRALSPILKESKYNPVHIMNIHKYQSRNKNGEQETDTVTLFIHGYAENTFRWLEQSYFRFFRNIFHSDVFFLELPHHFNRQPSDSPFSGAYFLNGNPIRMLEAIRQSIQEILFLIKYLKDTYDQVILFGVSLGGHLVALTSQFLEDIDIIAALASPFLFNLNPKIVPVSAKIVAQLKQESHLSWYKILYPCNIKYFIPFTTNSKTVIIGGIYDRIVPLSSVEDLSRMLQKPLLTYPGGHISLIIWLRSLLYQINNAFRK